MKNDTCPSMHTSTLMAIPPHMVIYLTYKIVMHLNTSYTLHLLKTMADNISEINI